MEVSLLGSLELRMDGAVLAVPPGRRRSLLACLALHANELVSRDRLVEALWGERAPRTALNALQVQVHALRKLVGDRLETRGPAYSLRLEPGELDTERFRTLAAQGRDELERGDPAAAASLLREALALWRGPALADVELDERAVTEPARLEEERLFALERRIEADLALGGHDSLVGELESLVAANPYRERFRAQLMLALYRSGRQADALAAYQQARRTLVDELGAEPGPELRALESALLRQDPALAAPARAAREPTNLPAALTQLVGRDLETAAVAALVRRPEVRLLTLTGPGGTGKTRLAVEAARELADGFAGGVHFVALAPLAHPRLVASTILSSLGVAEAADETLVQSLAGRLGDAPSLLVLDNFEHVATAAPLVTELLGALPRLKVLATSRGPLRLTGEHEYPVPPLRRDDAVELFVARTRAIRPDFEHTAANAGVVAEICMALDGLPLALELAAARMRLLEPTDLLGRLEDRLALLVEGPVDAPARQQTLRAAIEWSTGLLAERDRSFFASLGVFRGGWTVTAALEVCGEGGEELDGLVRESLVARRGRVGSEQRFGMLETIRSFALDDLAATGREQDLRRRHALYFTELAERSESELKGEHQRDWLARVDADHDNMRAALEWLQEQHDPGHRELELRLATALGWYWYAHGHGVEGARWLDTALADTNGAPDLLLGRAYHVRGILATLANDASRATELFERALVLFRRVGDERRIGNSLNSLAATAFGECEFDRARELFEEVIQLRRKADDRPSLAEPLSNLGTVSLYAGELASARALFEESVAIDRENHNGRGAAIGVGNLAAVALAEGDLAGAAALQVESLRALHDLGDTFSLAEALERGAALAAAVGDAELAARLAGAAARQRDQLGYPYTAADRDYLDRVLAPARAALGDGFAAAADEGARLELDEAVAAALREE